jgi:PKD repeat protein
MTRREAQMNRKKNVCALLTALLILAVIMFGLVSPSKSDQQILSALAITARPDQHIYFLRQKVTVNGSVTLNGSPATDLVVAVEVSNPSPFGPYSFSTLQIGNPTQIWLANISSISIADTADNPLDTIKVGSEMNVYMTVQNLQSNPATIYATTTVYDADMVPIGVNFISANLSPEQTITPTFQVQVPTWAASGQAKITGCVYSNEPKNGGTVYCPEKDFYYCISRTVSGLFGISQPSPSPPQTTPGAYADPVRLSPDPTPGEYSVYVVGQSGQITTSAATTDFEVQDTVGIPPQASFAYYPSAPVVNQTISFDGSSSSPEGYNDIITRYDWNFGDGTPDYVTTGSPAVPTASHAFTQATTYLVTLNVTNGEGLWCTTSKPVTVGLGHGPAANFTWTPQQVVINGSVTFDASNSAPGSISTLTNYLWNFSDGTGIYNLTTSQTSHSFINPGNYTVTLTVVDSLNRNASTSALIQVSNFTIKIYDVDGDGVIDGRDISIVAHAFGTVPGDKLWNPAADVLHVGAIDGRDLSAVARYFGDDP